MKQLLIFGIKAYRLLLSPWVGAQCRFEPTCSVYAMQAIQQHGAGVGSYLMTRRLLRCHPWCQGGCDPVPEQAPKLFTHLFKREADSAKAPSSIKPL